MISTPKIKYIIWDWNGTLIDDTWLFVDLMNAELNSRNLPVITIGDYQKYFTFPVKKYYETLGFDFNKEDFKDVGYAFIQKFKNRKFEAKLFSSTKYILNFVKKENIKQSIVSAQEHNLLNETVNHYQLNSYFESVLGIDNYYADSKIQIAKNLREKIKHKDKEILLIGDSTHDFEVSQALNINCVLYSKGHYTKKRLEKCNCPIIDNHQQLINILV